MKNSYDRQSASSKKKLSCWHTWVAVIPSTSHLAILILFLLLFKSNSFVFYQACQVGLWNSLLIENKYNIKDNLQQLLVSSSFWRSVAGRNTCFAIQASVYDYSPNPLFLALDQRWPGPKVRYCQFSVSVYLHADLLFINLRNEMHLIWVHFIICWFIVYKSEKWNAPNMGSLHNTRH